MTTSLEILRDASAEEARRFFADVEPEALVEAMRATDDDLLLELLTRDEVRPAAVTGIAQRLDEYAVPARLAEVKGLVRLDLHGDGTSAESRVLQLADGTLRLHEPDAAPGPADVTITTSVLRFVRLVSGERNAGLEYLGGTLDIDGDEMLALAVGGLFRVPGTDVALDPTALDPVDVATVLAGASTEHLRKVVSGAFRPIVLGEIFRQLPDHVNPRRAAKVRVTIAFRLTAGRRGSRPLRRDGGPRRHDGGRGRAGRRLRP